MDREKMLKYRDKFLEDIRKVSTPNSTPVTEESREGMLQALAIATASVFCAKQKIPNDPLTFASAAVNGMEDHLKYMGMQK